MKKILLVLLVFSLVGCKNEKSENTQIPEVIQQPVGNDFFRVTIDVVAKKDDAFHVFFTEDKSINFTEENSVWVEFKGSEASQKLVFDLPKDRFPNQLRLDFGINKDLGEVKINNIEVSYKGKTLNMAGAEFTKYFRPNESSTLVDPVNQSLKPAKPGLNTSLYPLETLSFELEKLLK